MATLKASRSLQILAQWRRALGKRMQAINQIQLLNAHCLKLHLGIPTKFLGFHASSRPVSISFSLPLWTFRPASYVLLLTSFETEDSCTPLSNAVGNPLLVFEMYLQFIFALRQCLHPHFKTERGIVHSKELSKFSVDYDFKSKRNSQVTKWGQINTIKTGQKSPYEFVQVNTIPASTQPERTGPAVDAPYRSIAMVESKARLSQCHESASEFTREECAGLSDVCRIL
ncbi:hypothetical protein B0H13DRAFT_1853706 [Mycena leptocephala]|nr:hypothetical protein B0H13DRAFT_1853706 [Mycena leptocephala]